MAWREHLVKDQADSPHDLQHEKSTVYQHIFGNRELHKSWLILPKGKVLEVFIRQPGDSISNGGGYSRAGGGQWEGNEFDL